MKESVKRRGTLAIILLVFGSLLVSGCMFPVVNTNPERPVDLGSSMELMILLFTLFFFQAAGRWESQLYPRWSVPGILGYNLALVLGGLGCRYLLELGEVSNTYNFTLGNVALHLTLTTAVATGSYAFQRRRRR